jgi:hypothetical protein
VAIKNQIIPVWDDVIDRASIITKRNAAIHTTRALNFGISVGQMHHKFFVMLGTCLWRFARLLKALIFQ